MKLYITKYEWEILLMAAIAGYVEYSYVQLNIWVLVVFYCLGITFEILTHKLWIYNKELHNSPLTFGPNFLWGLIKTPNINVNLVFGLGWLSVIVFSFANAKFVMEHTDFKNVFWVTIICIGITGNILEQLFYFLNLYRYNKESKWLRMPIINKYIEVWHIPLTVRINYFVVTGLSIYFGVTWLQKFFSSL